MNTPLHEEARSYGIDPIRYSGTEQLEKDVLAQRAIRQNQNAPQQPDVDSGNAKEAALPGAVGEKVENTKQNALQSPRQTARSTPKRR